MLVFVYVAKLYFHPWYLTASVSYRTDQLSFPRLLERWNFLQQLKKLNEFHLKFNDPLSIVLNLVLLNRRLYFSLKNLNPTLVFSFSGRISCIGRCKKKYYILITYVEWVSSSQFFPAFYLERITSWYLRENYLIYATLPPPHTPPGCIALKTVAVTIPTLVPLLIYAALPSYVDTKCVSDPGSPVSSV